MVFLFCISILIIIFLTSKIKIEIKKFKYTSTLPKNKRRDYEITIKLYVLGKIPIIKSRITKNKIEKYRKKGILKKVKLKEIEKEISIDKLPKLLKENKMDIKKIKLEIELGTENASATAILVPIISTIISFIIKQKVKDYKKQIFNIKPLFLNQNMVNIEISGIFEIKMIHIINIIYILNNKKGEDKNERTSNRRSYAYSYE